jgi:putative tryptophan/tyrosine transport system substrate-binding protein
MPVVGVVSVASPGTSRFLGFFLPQMKEFGWENGRNFRVIARFAEGQIDRFAALVDELVAQRVNVIVVFSDQAIQAAQRATATIPIVATASDLVKIGLAASMSKSGSNLTGVNVLAAELGAKRLEILHEAIADARRIGFLGQAEFVFSELDAAARQLALDLVRGITRGPDDVTRALDMLESAHVDAINVLDGPVTYATRAKIIEQLNRRHVPAIYPWPEAAEEGGLLGYGSRLEVQFRQIARLVSKILQGTRPQDLPIEECDRYDLVVNLRTARTIGLTVPPSILARADQVIE